MDNNIAMQIFPEFRIVYSNSVAVYEQTDFTMEIRTFVLVPVRDDGYVIVLRRVSGSTYEALKRWHLTVPAALTFHLDYYASYRIEVRVHAEMERAYGADSTGWVEIPPQNDTTDNTR